MSGSERKCKTSQEKRAQFNSILLKAKESCERYKLRDTASLSSFLLRDSSIRSMSSSSSILQRDTSIPSLGSLSINDQHEPTKENKVPISRMIPPNILPIKISLPEIQKPLTPKQKTPNRSKSAPPKANSIITVNGKVYEKCYRRGKGGSSYVYECRSDDLQCQVAVKIVDMEDLDPIVKEGYMNEVKLLQKLQGSDYIIKLYDYELRDDTLYVVLELGETDFLTYLNRKTQLEPLFIRVFFIQMLRCVKTIHDQNVVHCDLKPANFLMVSGDLKLIDFGISSEIPLDMTCVMKDHQAGTVNYMSPESFYDPDRGIELRKAADVWSLGCILYLMVFKTAPYAAYKDRRNAIINNRPISFKGCDDPKLIDLIKKCLTHDYKKRPTVAQLLKHEWLVC
uniref:Protein kinase domain-containing protein n=1 Tax=Panagrolaimus sp. JU765 TaxID=591449 RepID=A0AC34RDL8_9BILA